MHAFLYWTYLGGSPDSSTHPLDEPPIKGGLGGRQDPVPTLRTPKEADTPSSCLGQLGPWAGQRTLAPKTVNLQRVTCVEGWFEIVQDDTGE